MRSHRFLLLVFVWIELGCVGSLAPLSAGRKVFPAAKQPALQFSSPSQNQIVSGVVHLQVSGDVSAVASVEFRIGNHRIALCTDSFAWDWNSALAADGGSQIEAIARDSLNNVVLDDVRSVVIQNYGASASALGANLSSTPNPVWSGTVSLTLQAFDPKHYPAYWQVFVDGELAALRFTDQNGKNNASIQQNIDTTLYPNGRHEFHFAFHSNDYGNQSPPPGNEDFRGAVTYMVDIENGRTFMDVVARLLHVYTSVGGTAFLGCSRVFTNMDRSACLAPQYTSADPTIVSIDSAGTLTGLKEGFTDVQLQDGGKTTVIHVWVKSDLGVPHFAANGNISTVYQEGKSIFAVAPFLLEPGLLAADPTLLTEVQRAGINTLTRGFYQNVTDSSTTFTAWKQSFDAAVLPDWAFARDNGFRVLATGDELCRNIGSEGWRTLNWPAAQTAVQYAMQQYALSGVALSVDVVDEASGFWGSNPVPVGRIGQSHAMQSVSCTGSLCTVTWPDLSLNQFHDVVNAGGTFVLAGEPGLATPPDQVYTVANLTSTSFTFVPVAPVTGTFTAQTSPNLEYLWFAKGDTCSGRPCSPPVPNSALSTITGWLKSAPAGVPLAWPPQGIALTYVQSNWMGKGSLSDFASHYWDSNQQRATYIFGRGVRENVNSMLTPYYARQPFMQQDRPQFMLQSVSGINYTKNSPAGSDSYSPPVDELQHVGVVPPAVTAGMMAAAAAGVSGLRIYQFETAYDYLAEKNQGPGGGGVQTGAAPFYGEVQNWRSLGYSANVLTKVLQPYLLGRFLDSPAYGRNIVTGARQGASGNMLMVVNGWDGARSIAVDFQPYKFGNGESRYRVTDSGIQTAVLADQDGETITLAPGEAVIYLFPNQNAHPPMEAVSFQFPGAGSFQTIVHYAYAYPQNLRGFGDAVNCSQGCSLGIDRKLGDVFYDYTILDGCGRVLKKGDPAVLSTGNRVVVRTSGLRQATGCSR